MAKLKLLERGLLDAAQGVDDIHIRVSRRSRDKDAMDVDVLSPPAPLAKGTLQVTERRTVEEPTIIPAEDLFEIDIVSELPYREVVADTKEIYSGFMIDDERILGLIVSPVTPIPNCTLTRTQTDRQGNLTGIDVFVF